MAYGIQPFPVTLGLLNVYENQSFNNDEMIINCNFICEEVNIL